MDGVWQTRMSVTFVAAFWTLFLQCQPVFGMSSEGLFRTSGDMRIKENISIVLRLRILQAEDAIFDSAVRKSGCGCVVMVTVMCFAAAERKAGSSINLEQPQSSYGSARPREGSAKRGRI